MKNNVAAKRTSMAIIALLGWLGIILQFYLILQTTGSTGYSTLKLTLNFFSYFTILSNLLVAACLSSILIGPGSGLGAFFSKVPVQSAIAVYIFIVGLVYNLVLRGIVVVTGLNWIVDNILHVLVPVLYVLYWFVFTPGQALHRKNIPPWLIFPGVYLVYSLVRGPFVHWFPYPFLDTEKLGYGKVIVNSFFVLTAFLLVSLLLVVYNRSAKKINS
jgi:hypothetical protein